MVKFIVFGLAVVIKMFLTLRYIHAIIKFKYLAIAAGYLILNGVKLWLYAKQQKEASKVVHYTYSTTHDQDNENKDEDWNGESWKRRTRFGNEDDTEVPYNRHELSYPSLKQHDGMF